MSHRIAAVSVAADDVEAAEAFYAALGLTDRVRVHREETASEGFRGFTLSPLVADPRQADTFMEAAARAGGRTITPAKKSLWGYGGSVQAPDGTVLTIASSRKKPGDGTPPPLAYESVVLLLGVEDVKASKAFYTDAGLGVGKSFGKYVELDLPADSIQLALNGRKATAKNAGVDPAGSGSHGLMILGDLGGVTDPDGFVWATDAVAD